MTTVTCDDCKKDLTTAQNCAASRLALTCEAIPCTEYMISYGEPFPTVRDVHFCGLDCLARWVNKKILRVESKP